MAYEYKLKTRATLANSSLDWSLELENEAHMMQYQVYANILVAAVIAKLGDYALGLATDENAIQNGARKLEAAISKA